ncbi:MAG TPA: hypothetical protein VE377_22685 [Candidatus Dormibacteraeota bacterium]|nr:hypothetical protein [Candidatus Dormibacteraeota bacterium]
MICNSRVVFLSFFFSLFTIIPLWAQQGEAPIRLHPENPHYFLYQGKAVALVTSAGHYGAVINGEFDYHKYLAALDAAGMNYTRVFGGSYVEEPGKSFGIKRNNLAPEAGKLVAPWARSGEAGYAGGGNKLDLSKWNPEYFSRLHDFLKDASARGIVVEIGLFSSQYGEMQWNLSPFKRENNVNGTDTIDWKKVNTLENGNILAYQEKYVRKVVREANGYPNVMFEIANEPWSDRPVLADVVNPYLWTGRDQYPNSVDLPEEATMAWQARVAEWIVSEEAGLPGDSLSNKHLIAQDCCNFRYAMREVLPGVSVVNFHYAYAEAATLNYGLGKALSYDETGFLGQSDDAYARQAWNFMLAGGSVFDSLDYSFTVGHEDGSDVEPNGPGGGSPELRRRLKILSEFLRGLPLVEMRPDFELVKHAGGVVTHAMSSAREYAIYLDGNGPVELSLNLPVGEYAMWWVDVASGEKKYPGTVKYEGGELVVKSPAFRNGMAVRISRRESK